VFQKFRDFQQMVERRFDKKIIAMQTDWGGWVSKTQLFLSESWHNSSCLMSSCTSTKWSSW
jgi:hypothetical protein